MENRIKNSSSYDIHRKTKMSAEEVRVFLDTLKYSMEPLSRRISVSENGSIHSYVVERRGVGLLNTKYGKFWQYSFSINDRWEKYSVIVRAKIDNNTLNPIFESQSRLFLRTDSGCETGQVFGDLTCECYEQLQFAMKTLSIVGEGVIITIPHQDGRGMGLTFKLATLWLQDALKIDTVKSARLLAPDRVIDIRTYSGVICVLKFFGVPKGCRINLATNNPNKAEVFAENGYTVADYTPIVIEPNEYTETHLQAKQDHLGHKGLIKKRRKK